MSLLGLTEIKTNGGSEAIILITFFVLIQWPSIIGSKTSGPKLILLLFIYGDYSKLEFSKRILIFIKKYVIVEN